MKYTLDIIKKDFEEGKKLEFLFFWGHKPSKDAAITKSCFSQWWITRFSVDEIEYICMEQYMMAHKARLFGDKRLQDEIMKANLPSIMKAFGRKVKNFAENVWIENRYNIVLEGNIAKFSQNEDLKEFLVATGNKIIVEASPYDRIWGVGMSANNKNINNPNLWRGQNLLGFALMEVRDSLYFQELKK